MASVLRSYCYFRLFLTPLAQLEKDPASATLMSLFVVSYEVCAPIMFSFGIVANTLGLVTYIRMGLTDGVSVSFFALTLSDVCRSFSALLAWFCEFLSTVACASPNLLPLRKLVESYIAMFFDISVLTIIYISLQRCACVAFPLQVRGVFTTFRVTCLIAGIYVLVFAWYIPLLAQQHLEIQVDSGTNITVLKIIYTGVFYTLTNANFSVHILISIIAQIINLVCLAIFTKALIASSRFRLQNDASLPQRASSLKSEFKSGTPSPWPFLQRSRLHEVSRNISQQLESGTLPVCVNNSTITHCNDLFPVSHRSKTYHKPKDTNTSRTRTLGYSRKETQIIKVVTLTSAIFVVSNFPTACLSITNLVIPGFGIQREYRLVYSVTLVMKNFCEYLNSDLNFFVYLKCNNKFKEALYSTFNLRRCQSSKDATEEKRNNR